MFPPQHPSLPGHACCPARLATASIFKSHAHARATNLKSLHAPPRFCLTALFRSHAHPRAASISMRAGITPLDQTSPGDVHCGLADNTIAQSRLPCPRLAGARFWRNRCSFDPKVAAKSRVLHGLCMSSRSAAPTLSTPGGVRTGHLIPRAQCSTARRPPRAAECTGHLVPRAVVLPRPVTDALY